MKKIIIGNWKLNLDHLEAIATRSLYAKGLRAHAALVPTFCIPGPLLPIIPAPNYDDSKHHSLGRGRQHY